MDIQIEYERILGLLEEGDPDTALEAASDLERRHPEDPCALYLLAAAWRGTGEARECRRSARRALSRLQPGHPEHDELRNSVRFLLAWSSWQLWDFTAAEQHLDELLQSDPAEAAGWDLLATLLEQTGRAQDAELAGTQAERLDPENFPVPLRVADEELERVIQRAIEELPPELHSLVQELPIVIQDFPTRDMAAPPAADELPLAPDILGLYVGTSQLERSYLNPLEQPGTIFLFKRNLERMCPDLETLQEEIELTLHHELAHFAGFEEDEMPGLGLE